LLLVLLMMLMLLLADGSGFLATPVNPVFVLLALLRAAPNDQVMRMHGGACDTQRPL
jgi:hypothetical protein